MEWLACVCVYVWIIGNGKKDEEVCVSWVGMARVPSR